MVNRLVTHIPKNVALIIGSVLLVGGAVSLAFDNRTLVMHDFAGGCDGTDVSGYCWYLGSVSQSCATVCGSHGGYNIATRDFAGSGGTDENCRVVLAALGATGDAVTTEANTAGCYYNSSKAGRRRGTDATSDSASDANTERACACNS